MLRAQNPRWGKTTLGIDRLVQRALPGNPVAWCSPSYRMLTEVWRDVRRATAEVTTRTDSQQHRLELLGRRGDRDVEPRPARRRPGPTLRRGHRRRGGHGQALRGSLERRPAPHPGGLPGRGLVPLHPQGPQLLQAPLRPRGRPRLPGLGGLADAHRLQPLHPPGRGGRQPAHPPRAHVRPGVRGRLPGERGRRLPQGPGRRHRHPPARAHRRASIRHRGRLGAGARLHLHGRDRHHHPRAGLPRPQQPGGVRPPGGPAAGPGPALQARTPSTPSRTPWASPSWRPCSG